jgi:hypothetical protein
LESDGFNCPSCGQAVQFGADSAKLEHVDGSLMCAPGEEPEHNTFGPISAPVMPGEPEIPPAVADSLGRTGERTLPDDPFGVEEVTEYGTGKRGGDWGAVALLYVLLAVTVAGCFWFVIANWPGRR